MNGVSVYNTKATQISGVTFLIMHSMSNVMIIEYDNSSHVAIDKWDAFKSLKCFVYMTTVLKFSKLLLNIFRFSMKVSVIIGLKQGLLLTTGQKNEIVYKLIYFKFLS